MRTALLLFIVLIAGCVWGGDAPSKAASANCPQDSCYRDGLSLTEQGMCFFDLSVSCGDPNLCGKILDKEWEYRCRLRHSQYEVILCTGIANESMKSECYFNGAEIKKDESICKKLPDQNYRGYCMSNVARLTGRRTICGQITKQNMREFCFAVADRDLRICENIIDDDLRVKCVEWASADSIKSRLKKA